MYGINIKVNFCAFALPHRLNDATKDGCTRNVVQYLCHEDLGVKILIEKYGNDIPYLLRTWQNVKLRKVESQGQVKQLWKPEGGDIREHSHEFPRSRALCDKKCVIGDNEAIIHRRVLCLRKAGHVGSKCRSKVDQTRSRLIEADKYSIVLAAMGHKLIFSKPHLKVNFRNSNLGGLTNLASYERESIY